MSGIDQGASRHLRQYHNDLPTARPADVALFDLGQPFEYIGQVPGILLTKLPCGLNVATGSILFHCACESKKLTH